LIDRRFVIFAPLHAARREMLGRNELGACQYEYALENSEPVALSRGPAPLELEDYKGSRRMVLSDVKCLVSDETDYFLNVLDSE